MDGFLKSGFIFFVPCAYINPEELPGRRPAYFFSTREKCERNPSPWGFVKYQGIITRDVLVITAK